MSDETFTLDMDDLTIGDVEQIEEMTGEPMGALFNESTMSAKTLAAVVTVVKRRENPDYTLEDARKIKITSFSGGAGTDPTGDAA